MSPSPRSSSTSLRRLLVLLAGGVQTSGDGRGDTGCRGLGGVCDAAPRVDVQALLPAGVVAAGASVAMKGKQFELAPTVVAALPHR